MDKLLDKKFLKFQKDVNKSWPDSTDIYEDLTAMGNGITGNSTSINNKFKLLIQHKELLQVKDITNDLGDIFFYMVRIMDVFKISLTDVMKDNINKRKHSGKEDHRYKSYLLEG
jgi:hypothetical protein